MAMKLMLLLMLALPALSSGKDNTKPGMVRSPRLEQAVPKIPLNRSTDQPLPSHLVNREKRSGVYTRKLGHTNLEWQWWTGSLPNGAVAIYNDYEKRTDYVCKDGCEVGFYNSGMGPYCHYPFALKEYRGTDFEILVNKDNFEFLEWKHGSWGSVPKNSVPTCSGSRTIYVGKNKYGLGKVHTEHQRFYLPWQGKEYWYNDYQVLTYDTEISSEQISDVKYKLDAAKIFKNSPQTMHQSTVTNNECHKITKKVTLSKETQVTQTWESSFSITKGVTASITAQLPVVSASVGLSLETTFQVTNGLSHSETTTHSVDVELTVLPNHSCSVKMVGYKYKADIPFTARVTRKYKNGETKWEYISGTYKGVQVGDVRAVVDRCQPIPNAKPCKVKVI
ncbi:natterin-3-like [Anabas testudineus]|uniref:natterin-3-like n=1 Tax=Anabas testudineus TaxID=64144 RepID=UPI000E454062|nr:natterin-3-like [Anabas testudineus]